MKAIWKTASTHRWRTCASLCAKDYK